MDVAEHAPVMVGRVVALLAPAVSVPDAVLVDATLGLGGHAEALLREYPRLRVIGLDRDDEALERARTRLAPHAARTTFIHAIYSDISDILVRLGHRRVDGVLFDLGVSSLQLDFAERGFAYSYDAPLDMRMDRSGGKTAADVVNTYPAAELARILREYGEERFARRIAGALVREREKDPLTSTLRLAEIVRSAIPAATRRTGGHPAKRTFQALRIEVNRELDALERALPQAINALAVRGRIAVLAYHSLEDRLVKREFAAGAKDGTPERLPVREEQPRLRLLTKGAEKPSPEEVAANPRAGSARLRAAQKVREEAA